MVTGYFPIWVTSIKHCTMFMWYLKHLLPCCNYLHSCEMGHCLCLSYFSDNLIIVEHLIVFMVLVMNIATITACQFFAY